MLRYLFLLFWFVREIKAVLFWLYLWQLKEYHIGRFIDHFRTEKGKRLILNELLFLKIILLIGVFSLPLSRYYRLIFSLLFFLYFLESGKLFYDLFLGKFKKPVFTVKTIFLLIISSVIVFGFGINALLNGLLAKDLLVFDLVTPVIISGLVLLFQPLAVIWRSLLLKRAKKKREKFKDLTVIGITGSYGKTSTKELLYEILSEKFNVLKTKKHQNSEIGIAQCVLGELKEEYEVFIVEMGAYNKGGIKLLCEIVKPQIGILTGLNRQHLATFGSFQNIIEAKLELVKSLPEDGVAIFNGSNDTIWNLQSEISNYNSELEKKIFCSIKHRNADFYADAIQVKKKALLFDVVKGNLKVPFKLNLLGKHHIENTLLAVACAQELGIELKEASRICKKINDLFGTVKLYKDKRGVDVITSTYSANPTGVLAHLDYLKKWKGKKVVIMPCLIELGDSSARLHKKIGRKIGKVCDLAIITTKEKFGELQSGAIQEGMPRRDILFSKKPEEILHKLEKYFQEDNVILLEGRISKAIKEKIIQNEFKN